MQRCGQPRTLRGDQLCRLAVFPVSLKLRMVEEMLAVRGICVTYETVRQWEKKFGRAFSDQIRQHAPARGDKWHLDEVVVSIAGEQHWLSRGRSEWFRARRLGPASKRFPRCAAAYGEAPEIRRRTAAGHDQRQAPFVWRCAGEDGPSRRTPPAQGSEQSGGEFSSADKTTRTDHEAIQIRSTGATVSVGSRSSRESLLHSLSRIRHC